MWRYLLFFVVLGAGAQRTLVVDSVVVTATRSERHLADVAVPTTVVGCAEIRQSGAATTEEVLRNALPGLVFTPDAMGNNLRLRGLTTRYVLILVDGERLVGEGAGGNINLDRVEVGEIERIEIVGGAGAALWGAGAVGAVVNIITRDRTAAEVGWGSNNTWRVGASAAGRKDNFEGSGNIFRNSTGGFEGGNPYTDRGGAGRVKWSRGKFGAAVRGRFLSHETFNPEGVVNAAHKLSRSWAAGASSSYGGLKVSINSDNFLDYTVRGRENHKDNRASLLGVRATENLRLNDKIELVGGAEFNHEEAFATSTMGAAPATHALNDGAIFAQLAAKNYVLGARYTRSGQFGGAFSPSAAALLRHHSWTFRAGAATSFRPPSIKELHYNFDHQGMFWIVGNPHLKAEKGLYSQLSAEYSRPRLNVSTTIYRNDIRNKITQYQLAAARTELHYKNVGSATLQGVETSVLWFPCDYFGVRAAYTFCDAVDNSTRRQLIGNPRHSAVGALTYTGWLTAQLGVRTTSSYGYLNLAGDTVSAASSVVWRLAVSREMGNFAAAARLENLFDRRTLSDPAGRTFLLILKYKI